MIVSAFTYVRNGLTLGYPFIESIRSLLPIVDEYIVVVGDSIDGSRAAVEALNDPRIRIIDTVWDETMRTGGKVFAQQANIGMEHCRRDADWLFHLQADEVLHENDLSLLKSAMEQHLPDRRLDGLLLPFIHFYGDYAHYAPSRRFHKYEVRIVRNNPSIRSFKDSMGFRKFADPSRSDEDKGDKLQVALVKAPVFHYSWARPPKKLTAKRLEFHKRYHQPDDFSDYLDRTEPEGYGYRDYDYLRPFSGTHPAIMQATVAAQDWTFVYDPRKNNMTFKEKVLKVVEELTGTQWFTYRNYRRIK